MRSSQSSCRKESCHLELVEVKPLHVPNVEQPVLEQTVVHVLHRGPDAATAVVPADDDVGHL